MQKLGIAVGYEAGWYLWKVSLAAVKRHAISCRCCPDQTDSLVPNSPLDFHQITLILIVTWTFPAIEGSG